MRVLEGPHTERMQGKEVVTFQVQAIGGGKAKAVFRERPLQQVALRSLRVGRDCVLSGTLTPDRVLYVEAIAS